VVGLLPRIEIVPVGNQCIKEKVLKLRVKLHLVRDTRENLDDVFWPRGRHILYAEVVQLLGMLFQRPLIQQLEVLLHSHPIPGVWKEQSGSGTLGREHMSWRRTDSQLDRG